MAFSGRTFVRVAARACVALGIGAALLPAAAAAEAFVGVETLAAIPTSSARASTRPGGAFHLNGGLRHSLGSSFAVSLVGGGGATMFEAHCGASAPVCTDDEVTTVLSLTAGPRLSLVDGAFELFFGGRGGVYRGVSGGLTETAGGWALETGAAYELVPGTTAGAVVRREKVGIDADRDGSDLEFFVIGLGFEHRFGAPPQPGPGPEF